MKKNVLRTQKQLAVGNPKRYKSIEKLEKKKESEKWILVFEKGNSRVCKTTVGSEATQ